MSSQNVHSKEGAYSVDEFSSKLFLMHNSTKYNTLFSSVKNAKSDVKDNDPDLLVFLINVQGTVTRAED